jgi:hypothetical protein
LSHATHCNSILLKDKKFGTAFAAKTIPKIWRVESMNLMGKPAGLPRRVSWNKINGLMDRWIQPPNPAPAGSKKLDFFPR